MTPEQEAAIRRAEQKMALDRAEAKLSAPAQGTTPEKTPLSRMAAGTLDAFTQGVSFGFGDELTALEKAILGGTKEEGFWDEYSRFLEAERAQQGAFSEANPELALGAEIAGAVAGPVGLARQGMTVVGRGSTVLGRMGRTAIEGGMYGGAQGFGSGEGAAERVRLMGWGFGLGAGAGAALSKAGDTVGGMLERRALRRAAPELDQLREARDVAYAAVREAGEAYSPKQLGQLADNLDAALRRGRANPIRHPAAISMADDIKVAIKGNEPVDLTSVDQIRQQVFRDVASRADGGEAYLGREMMDVLDDFIEEVGDAPTMRAAREAHRRVKATEAITEAFDAADLSAAASGTGGNINNSVRQRIAAILKNKKKLRGFRPEEVQAMRDIVKRRPTDNALRLIGRMAPNGAPSLYFNIFAAQMNPSLAVLPAIGSIAKATADGGTKRGVEALRGVIAGAPPALRKALATEKEAVRRALAGDLGAEIAIEATE